MTGLQSKNWEKIRKTGYYKINMILALNHKKRTVFTERFWQMYWGREMPFLNYRMLS